VKENSSNAVLEVIGSLTDDGVFIYNLESHELEYVNDSMVRIFDISHQSFKHQTDFFINHIIPEDFGHVNLEFEKLKQQSVVENVEFHVKTHENGVKIISCNGYVIEKKIFGFVKDITKVREHEDYITNYGAKKDALLDMVSHNLSGPLNVTQQIIFSMEKTLSNQRNEELDKHLKLVRESTTHCIEIVNDFLEEEHLVSEHIYLKRTRFDILEKINAMLERMRKSYSQKQFLLTTSVSNLYIDNDDVKFMQVVQNLLSNAIKFTKPDGTIEVLVKGTKRKVRIDFKDNGIGIPENLKPVIFEKYTPAGRPGVGGEKSIGMGLYIVRKLVNLMQGRIFYESQEHVGSVFTIEFPLDSHPK
jgi:two-component system, OmpR family, sensor histidine kinase VicK